jgi:hypothetical protein
MHPDVRSNIFLMEFTLFMPDVFLKYEICNIKHEKNKKRKKEKEKHR